MIFKNVLDDYVMLCDGLIRQSIRVGHSDVRGALIVPAPEGRSEFVSDMAVAGGAIGESSSARARAPYPVPGRFIGGFYSEDYYEKIFFSNMRSTPLKLLMLLEALVLAGATPVVAQDTTYIWQSADGDPYNIQAAIVLDSPSSTNGSASDVVSLSVTDTRGTY